jgi:hypothetical protein
MHHLRLKADETGWPSTIAGAIDILRNQAGFDSRHIANIASAPLRLPCDDIVWSMHAVFEVDADIRVYVSLPESTEFQAVSADNSERQTFHSTLLDGGIVNAAGHVFLADGRELRAVEIIPAITSPFPSMLDYVIIHCLIECNRAESRCYRNLVDDLPACVRNKDWGDLRIVHCEHLQQLEVPPLKVLLGYIKKRCPGHPAPSEQKVADTLRAFGLRIPRPRPRRGRRAAMLS